jgi:hypothetical protein
MSTRFLLFVSSLWLIVNQAIVYGCDINTSGAFNDQDLIKKYFKNEPQVEIFKIQRIALYTGKYASMVFKTFTALAGIQTTYLLNNGKTLSVCHGERRADRLKVNAKLASDEYLTEIRWRVVGNRVDNVVMKTNKRELGPVGGSSGLGSSSGPPTPPSGSLTAPSGKVIQALAGTELNGFTKSFSNPVFSKKPNADTIYLVEITGEITFTPRVSNAEALLVDSPDGRVTVDNSDVDAIETQSQTLSFSETYTSSETNTVSETFSASASVSTTASASVALKGVFEVGVSTTFTAGFGFEKSLEQSKTITKSRELSITSPVVASPGTITTGTVYIRQVNYVIDWEASAKVYYLGNLGTAVNKDLSGTLEGEQAIDAALDIDVENVGEEEEEEVVEVEEEEEEEEEEEVVDKGITDTDNTEPVGAAGGGSATSAVESGQQGGDISAVQLRGS